jgi:pentatricopeptide repeat protein
MIPWCRYNALLNASLKGKSFDKTFELLKQMQADGVDPDSFTYITLITGLSCEGMGAKALELLEEMRNKGMEPNQVCYSSVVKGLCSEVTPGSLEKAYAVLADMRVRGITLPDVTYTSIIEATAKRGGYKEAQGLIEELRKAGTSPALTSQNFNAYIDGCCAGGELMKGFEMIAIMKNSGVKPDVRSYNILLEGAIKTHNVKQAFEVFDSLKREGIPPTFSPTTT